MRLLRCESRLWPNSELRALHPGSAELLRLGEIFRRVAKLFLAGLDCAPRFVLQLVDTRATSLQCTQIKNKVSLLLFPCVTIRYKSVARYETR